MVDSLPTVRDTEELITIEQILDKRRKALGEKELWSVLNECLTAVDDALAANSKEFIKFSISPDTVGINTKNGKIQFVKSSKEIDDLYTAPEVPLNASSQVFSIGIVLLYCASYGIKASDELPEVAVDFLGIIESMTRNDYASRMKLTEALKIVEERCLIPSNLVCKKMVSEWKTFEDESDCFLEREVSLMYTTDDDQQMAFKWKIQRKFQCKPVEERSDSDKDDIVNVPYPDMDKSVSLQVVLEKIGCGLEERELWAVCHQVCKCLEEVEQIPTYLSTETVLLNEEGRASFLLKEKQNVDPIFLAPEVTSQTKDPIKTCLFSLGILLFQCADFRLPASRSPGLSPKIEALIDALADDEVLNRPDLKIVLEECEKSCAEEGLNPSDLCSNLAKDAQVLVECQRGKVEEDKNPIWRKIMDEIQSGVELKPKEERKIQLKEIKEVHTARDLLLQGIRRGKKLRRCSKPKIADFRDWLTKEDMERLKKFNNISKESDKKIKEVRAIKESIKTPSVPAFFPFEGLSPKWALIPIEHLEPRPNKKLHRTKSDLTIRKRPGTPPPDLRQTVRQVKAKSAFKKVHSPPPLPLSPVNTDSGISGTSYLLDKLLGGESAKRQKKVTGVVRILREEFSWDTFIDSTIEEANMAEDIVNLAGLSRKTFGSAVEEKWSDFAWSDQLLNSLYRFVSEDDDESKMSIKSVEYSGRSTPRNQGLQGHSTPYGEIFPHRNSLINRSLSIHNENFNRPFICNIQLDDDHSSSKTSRVQSPKLKKSNNLSHSLLNIQDLKSGQGQMITVFDDTEKVERVRSETMQPNRNVVDRNRMLQGRDLTFRRTEINRAQSLYDVREPKKIICGPVARYTTESGDDMSESEKKLYIRRASSEIQTTKSYSNIETGRCSLYPKRFPPREIIYFSKDNSNFVIENKRTISDLDQQIFIRERERRTAARHARKLIDIGGRGQLTTRILDQLRSLTEDVQHLKKEKQRILAAQFDDQALDSCYLYALAHLQSDSEFRLINCHNAFIQNGPDDEFFAGDPEGFLAQLYGKGVFSNDFVRVFFITYRYIMSREVLADFLLSKLKCFEDAELTDEVDMLKTRTAFLIAVWTGLFRECDFGVDDYGERFNARLLGTIDNNSNYDWLEVRENKERNLESDSEDEFDMLCTAHQNFKVKIKKPLPEGDWSLSEIDPDRLAEQLTLLEKELFDVLHPINVLNSKGQGIDITLFTKVLIDRASNVRRSLKNRRTESEESLFVGTYAFDDRLADVVQRSCDITHWAVAEILRSNSRRKNLIQVILTAEKCWNLCNYSTCSSLIDALDMVLIRTLDCWKSLPSNIDKIVKKLNNYKLLMQTNPVPKTDKPYLPPIAYLLIHIQKAESGNFKLANGMFKYSKLRTIADLADLVRRRGSYHTKLNSDLNLQRILRRRITQLSRADLQALAAVAHKTPANSGKLNFFSQFAKKFLNN
ncbi:DgyrCDS6364 [Dimorphilus gyrociliatus]|uniref:DgyrCDS6364 n=1 Tax=Dimorphilus gyrociliatus TaxID=2664684 RepID=A0A7I8VMU3_9ANNE|nr:DgyrCDS6364 [Dimorphilus gyrociliatus]